VEWLTRLAGPAPRRLPLAEWVSKWAGASDTDDIRPLHRRVLRALMGILAVSVAQFLGVVFMGVGFTYLVRGANLPGRAGTFIVPNSEEWRVWMAAAPSGYWRANGLQTSLYGAAVVLMGQGCFHHLLFLPVLAAFSLAVMIGLTARARYGPFPPRSRGYWIRYSIVFIPTYVAVQVVIHTGAFNICL
jgi:hypothetical protein